MYRIENYIEDVKRTENIENESIRERLNNNELIRLLHSGLGMSNEANEALDMLKKHIFYGAELDLVNLEEEIGDLLFYTAISLDVLGLSFNEVMKTNIDKLKLRYPDGFSKEKAINRDLEGERKILEKDV